MAVIWGKASGQWQNPLNDEIGECYVFYQDEWKSAKTMQINVLDEWINIDASAPQDPIKGYFWAGRDGSTRKNHIYYHDCLTTSGNASSVGTCITKQYPGGAQGATYCWSFGGYPSPKNWIEYLSNTTTSGNATDKGDITLGRQLGCGLNDMNGTYGFYCGGQNGGKRNHIDYINITTTSGNGTDKGDLTQSKSGQAGASSFVSGEYGWIGGGNTGSYTNVMEYIDLTTTSGNGSDVADLLAAKVGMGGTDARAAGSTDYCNWVGGRNGGNTNVIEYFNGTTNSGGGVDKGDLTLARRFGRCNDGTTYSFCLGGYTSASVNVIDYFNSTSTTGGATDKGDLPGNRHGGAGNNG